jgi:hypothetical protein
MHFEVRVGSASIADALPRSLQALISAIPYHRAFFAGPCRPGFAGRFAADYLLADFFLWSRSPASPSAARV